MLHSIFRFLRGYLRIRVTGYSPERFINLCQYRKMDVWGLKASHNAYEMYIYVRDFKKIKPILRKTKTKVMIEERFGLPFFFYAYRKRWFFFSGILLSIVFAYSLTLFVWDIKIDGNQTVTDNQLIEYLDGIEVKCGILKYNINCKMLDKQIRQTFDDIIWVSASLDGSILQITIKENSDTFTEIDTQIEASDIVADKSGVIYQIITRQGVPQVKKGDTIEQGSVLVSGAVPIQNDAKEIISYKYLHADADILLYSVFEYHDTIKSAYIQKAYTDKKRIIYSLKIGDYLLHAGIKRNTFHFKEIHRSEKQIKLGEHFYLPISIGRSEILAYETEEFEYTQKEMENILASNLEQYCKELRDNGVQIISQNLQYVSGKDALHLKGTIEIIQEVGIHRKIVDLSQEPVIE